MSQTLEAIRQSIKQKLEDRTRSAGEAFKSETGFVAIPLAVLIDVVVAVAKDGKFNKDDLEPVVTVAEELFETHVRPYDIPGIGPIVEKYVDDTLKGTIRPVLTAAFDRFVK